MGVLLVTFLVVVALVFKYPSGPPLGASCSAVISAACQARRVEGDYRQEMVGEDITNKPLMWGVTVEGSRDVFGHCSFSAEEVSKPRTGHLYAGMF